MATDLAARGLDIKNVDLIINYTLPKTVKKLIIRFKVIFIELVEQGGLGTKVYQLHFLLKKIDN